MKETVSPEAMVPTREAGALPPPERPWHWMLVNNATIRQDDLTLHDRKVKDILDGSKILDKPCTKHLKGRQSNRVVQERRYSQFGGILRTIRFG